jgi:MFS family permease
VMPLYAILVREYFPVGIMGLGCRRCHDSTLGTALGPLIGGWRFDSFSSYLWLYVGSLGLGLAMAIALTIRPASLAVVRLSPNMG